jgi:hypothetical protein
MNAFALTGSTRAAHDRARQAPQTGNRFCRAQMGSQRAPSMARIRA